MNILHIVGKDLIEGNGITSAVPPLIREQNKINGINSRLLVISENKLEYKKMFGVDFKIYSKIEDIYLYLEKEYIPDIVIFHEIYHFKFIKIYPKLLKLKIPYIVKPHCSLTKAAQSKGKLKKDLANTLFFKKFIENSVAVSFLNESEQSKSKKYRFNSIIVNNGVYCNIDKHMIDKKINKNEISIIFLSRIDLYHKGLDVLLEGIADIKEDIFYNKKFNINIYGSGNERDVEYLKDKINQMNNNKVKYNGPVFGIEKENIIKNSDIFVLTSRLEGMPMAILECWANGMPCIITPGTNMCDDLYSNNKLGWVTGLDKNEIRETILKAIEEYKDDKKLYFENCTSWVEKNYKWERIAVDSVQKYKKFIK